MNKPPVLLASDAVRATTTLSRVVSKLRDVTILSPKAKILIPQLRPSLSQLPFGACVGFAFTNWLNCDTPHPYYNLDREFALRLWEWSKIHDRDPVTSPDDPNSGTYAWTAGIRLKKFGYVTRQDPYGIAYEKDLRKYILQTGPTPISIPWYEGFDAPTDGTRGHGYIELTGELRGGHCILCFWFDQNTKRYWLYNSWGGYEPYDKYNQIVEIRASDMKKVLNRGGWGMKMDKNPNRQV